MKTSLTLVRISSITILILLASCTTTFMPAVPTLQLQASNTAETMAPTDTPDVSSPTGTFVVPTATEFTGMPTLTPVTDTLTITPTFSPPASPPPPISTTVIQIDASYLSGLFKVPARTNLTLRDVGPDGISNTCTISGSRPLFFTRIDVPINAVSLPFQLEPGRYTLNCGRPRQYATIVSSTR